MEGLEAAYNVSDMINVSMALTENTSDNATNDVLTTVSRITASCSLFRFILYSVVCVALCLIGFFGNIVSYLVLQKDKSSPVASLLLQSLAIADNAFLFFWMAHYPLHSLHAHFFGATTRGTDNHLQVALLYLRVYTFPLLFMTQTQTIWLTVIIAANRFIAVCLPYSAPHLCTLTNVRRELFVVTAFSLFYNLPRFFELQVITQADNKTHWNRTTLGTDVYYQKVYLDGLYYVFSFILPLLILSFVNTKIIVAYRATQQRRRRMTSRRCDNENNITLVMIIVIVIFMLCQAPARIVQIVWGYKYKHCAEFIYYLIHITNTFEVLNSSVNFLIYFLFRKRFRDILCAHFCLETITFWRRPLSQGVTTTEGLSLVEIGQTSSGNRSQESNTTRNGFIPRDRAKPNTPDEHQSCDSSTNHKTIEVVNGVHQRNSEKEQAVEIYNNENEPLAL